MIAILEAAPAPPAEVEELLDALAVSKYAFVFLSRLAEDLGREPPALSALLDEAVRLGLAEIWRDTPGGDPAAILSSLSAERRGLELIAPQDHNPHPLRFRWIAIGRAPAERATSLVESELVDERREGGDACRFDLIVGRSPDPASVAANGSYLDAASRRGDGGRAEYSSASLSGIILHVLGIRPTWPVSRSPCGGCGGRFLRKVETCVCCDRSGIDHLLPRVTRPKAVVAHSTDGLAGGKGRKPKSKPKPKRCA